MPLGYMDVTSERYMLLSTEMTWKYYLNLLYEVNECGGVLTILCYNTGSFKDLELYERILYTASSMNGWLASAAEIYKLWIKNDLITSWTILQECE